MRFRSVTPTSHLRCPAPWKMAADFALPLAPKWKLALGCTLQHESKEVETIPPFSAAALREIAAIHPFSSFAFCSTPANGENLRVASGRLCLTSLSCGACKRLHWGRSQQAPPSGQTSKLTRRCFRELPDAVLWCTPPKTCRKIQKEKCSDRKSSAAIRPLWWNAWFTHRWRR